MCSIIINSHWWFQVFSLDRFVTTVFVSIAAAASEIFKLQWSSVFLVFYLSQSNETNRQNAFMYISRLSLGKLWMIVNNILGLFLVTSIWPIWGRLPHSVLNLLLQYSSYRRMQYVLIYANCQQKDILNSEMDYSRARGRKWICKHVTVLEKDQVQYSSILC